LTATSFVVRQSLSLSETLSLLFPFRFIIPNELPSEAVHPDIKSHPNLFPPEAPIQSQFNSSKNLFYQLLKL
jgi:hypothetical protein